MPEFALNKNNIAALVRIRDHGSSAWCEGQGRAGGAISRMFDRLQAWGYCSAPPYTLTQKGKEYLDAQAKKRDRKNGGEAEKPAADEK